MNEKPEDFRDEDHNFAVISIPMQASTNTSGEVTRWRRGGVWSEELTSELW